MQILCRRRRLRTPSVGGSEAEVELRQGSLEETVNAAGDDDFRSVARHWTG